MRMRLCLCVHLLSRAVILCAPSPPTRSRRYKFVSVKPNRDNAVRLRLPGTTRSHPDMPLWWQTDILREWRKALLLPPRTSDLWRSAHFIAYRVSSLEVVATTTKP